MTNDDERDYVEEAANRAELSVFSIAITHPKGFGGHEFEYQQSNDLFKCVHCGQYELMVRGDDGEISPCPAAPTDEAANRAEMETVDHPDKTTEGDEMSETVKRYDANKDLTPADQDAMRELVRSLGHDPDDMIAAKFAITVDQLGVRLHLSEFLLSDTGFRVYDLAADHMATRPHIHDIDPARLPASIRPVEVAGGAA